MNLFIDVFKLKNQYIYSFDEDIKKKYRPILSKIIDSFDNDREVYAISKLSKNIINTTDFQKIKEKRRVNYSVLHEGLKEFKILSPVFNILGKGITPLYFTIYVHGDRSEMQNMLAENNIYCPVIWPIPESITDYYQDDSLSYFEHILSIPCDQRYNQSDMARIVNCIKKYQD